MRTDELIASIAATLRTDIAPAVGEEFARTQAFMAAVVLERVAREVALGPANAEAESTDAAELHRALRPVLENAPPSVNAALDELGQAVDLAATAPLIDALYEWGTDQPAAIEALGLLRPYLRRDIDRRMKVAT
ncbi:MAG: hypothetical protein ACR2QO_00585 [Acidimicrobiales bacterium]